MTARNQLRDPPDEGCRSRVLPEASWERSGPVGPAGEYGGQPIGIVQGWRSRSSAPSPRGQTEPLAALVAVAVVCLAVSAHAGLLTGLFPQFGADRSLGEGTAERVWRAISEDGVYDSSGNLTDDIEAKTLPQGKYVAISVTYVGEGGRLESAGNGTFDPHADRVALEPPETAERYERVLPVKFGPGDVRSGTLRVVIWS